MRYLIDTHVLIWFAEGTRDVPAPVVAAMKHAGRGQLIFSAASVWEMAIKTRLGKLQCSPDLATYLQGVTSRLGCLLLPISAAHALEVATLPDIAGHRDPFDRLLAAQARIEKLTMISADRLFEGYGVPVLWAT